MRSVVSPRDAIDAFERAHPELSSEEVQFLDRLRSERFVREVVTIWRYIGTADAHVIESVVKALRVAKALPHVPAETEKAKRELTAAKNAVRVLRKRFAQDHRAEAENLRRGLAWAEKDFELSESLCDLDLIGDAGTTVALNAEGNLPRRSRKYKTLAAQRRTFMVQVGRAMQAIFRRPCGVAVAALTTVAFEVDTSIDDVRNANRSIRRKI
jgi:hypothetical protein